MINSKRINIGLNILRMWMAFEVVLLHRCSWSSYQSPFFQFLKACELFSVPVFVIMSFYLTEKTITEQNNDKIKNRFVRLIIPQIGWGIICWIVYSLTDIVFAHKLDHNFSDLLWQLFTGANNSVNPSLWYQMVLIILTIVFVLVFKLLKKEKGWIAVFVLLVLSIIIQADGSYYTFFTNTRYEIENTIGRIFEIMPFACIGLLLSRYSVFEQLQDKRYIIIILSVILFIIGFYIPFPAFLGFFAGLRPIYMSLLLFAIFYLLPLDNISDKAKNIVLKLTRYTLGIYCAHRMVYSILDIIYELLGLNFGSFTKCISVYVVCYIMSYIMSLIKCEYIKKLVD